MRRIFRRLFAVVAVCVLSIGTAELFCRVTGMGKCLVYPRGLYRSSPDHVLSTEFTPLFNGRAYGTAVRINSMGFRGGEIAKEPAPGTFRVVCVGDSFTFGMGVEETETWPYLLGQQLRVPQGYRKVEVINAGTPGYNLRQDIEAASTKVTGLKPNLIVLGIVMNDLEPPFAVRDGYLCVPAKKYSLPIPGKRWFQTHSYAYQFLSLKYAAVVARLAGQSNENTPRDPALAAQTRRALPDSETALQDLIDIVNVRCNAEVAVVLLGVPAESPLIDIGNIVKCHRVRTDPLLTLPDGHPDAQGHKYIADQVKDILEKNVLPHDGQTDAAISGQGALPEIQ